MGSSMNGLKRFSKAPSGQALLATLFFCFIFSALFIGLFQAAAAYTHKERVRRSTDLSVLSAGAVYANGLRLVRASNVILMLAVAADLAKMGIAVAPFVPLFPASIPQAITAAKAADQVRARDKVQRLQSVLFGVPLPGNLGRGLGRGAFGVYPSWIEWKAQEAARHNGFDRTLLNSQFFYNLPSPRHLVACRLPDMALRFRTADELLPSEPSSLYSLTYQGKRHYFSGSEVEDAQNPRLPDQKRVRLASPSPFAGRWVKKEVEGSSSENPLSRYTGIGPWAWSLLRDLLKGMVLDLTHREDPPFHTMTLGARMPRTIGKREITVWETSEVVLAGKGLAAWDLREPPFKLHLQKSKLDPTILLTGSSAQGSKP